MNKKNEFTLMSISPIDGRYSHQIDQEIKKINSEFGLIKYRVHVEVSWFIFLLSIAPIKKKFGINKNEKDYLIKISKNFNLKDALEIKEIEKKINHDVKSVEYFLKNKFDKHKTLKNKKELIHFCATSEDINNISYALMYVDSRKILLKKLNEVFVILKKYEKNMLILQCYLGLMVKKLHQQLLARS